MPFHFQDGNSNWLTIAALDRVSKAPEYKVCAVKWKRRKKAIEDSSWNNEGPYQGSFAYRVKVAASAAPRKAGKGNL